MPSRYKVKLCVCAERVMRRASPVEATLQPFVPSPADALHSERRMLSHTSNVPSSSAPSFLPAQSATSRGGRKLLLQPFVPAHPARSEADKPNSSGICCASGDSILNNPVAAMKEHQVAAKASVKKSLFLNDPGKVVMHAKPFSTENCSDVPDTNGAVEQGMQRALHGDAASCSQPGASDTPDFASVFDFL